MLLLICVPNVQLSVLMISNLLLQLTIFLLFLKLLPDVGVPALDESAFAGDPAGFIAVAIVVFSFSWRACCGWPLPASGFWWSPYSCPALGAVLTVAGIPMLKCL